MADWLVATGIKTVAMESTGVYWVPVYEVLEGRGSVIRPTPERREQFRPQVGCQRCAVVARLHAVLLRASFRPGRDIAALRVYFPAARTTPGLRGSAYPAHAEGVDLHEPAVAPCRCGRVTVTGMKIIRAINGQRDPQVLAQMRDVRCKASMETCAPPGGKLPTRARLALSQALALYDFYQARVDECDAQIEVAGFAHHGQGRSGELRCRRRATARFVPPCFDVRPVLYQLAGVDLTQIHGIGPYLALRMIAECGMT